MMVQMVHANRILADLTSTPSTNTDMYILVVHLYDFHRDKKLFRSIFWYTYPVHVRRVMKLQWNGQALRCGGRNPDCAPSRSRSFFEGPTCLAPEIASLDTKLPFSSTHLD